MQAFIENDALTFASTSARPPMDELQRQLSSLGRRRLTPGCPEEGFITPAEDAGLASLEQAFLQTERDKIAARALRAPTDVDGFVAWWESLREVGPGQGDALFEWLAEEASLEQMRWFIHQELVGEAGFDDLLALTQLRMPVQAKLEMARNYWDEMGRGRRHAMHGPLLDRAGHLLEAYDPAIGALVWESLALANLMVGLCYNRRYAFHAAGALGVVELTAPSRTRLVADGLRRLGVPKEATYYFALHSTVDIAHSKAWVDNVLRSLVAEDPRRARWLAEGALMRLNAGARCFDRYRRHFGLEGAQAYLNGEERA